MIKHMPVYTQHIMILLKIIWVRIPAREEAETSAPCAGEIVDMKELGVWEPYEVKVQTIKTAVESATLLLRIDDIVSGISKKDKTAPGQSRAAGPQDPDAVRR